MVRENEAREALIWPVRVSHVASRQKVGKVVPSSAGEVSEPSANASRSFRIAVPCRKAELYKVFLTVVS